MRHLRKFILLASLMFAPAVMAANSCGDALNSIVGTSSYITTNMVSVPAEHEGQLTFRHKDDTRIIVNFESKHSQAVTGLSRGVYVNRLKEYAESYTSRIKSEGRWAEASVFPYEPLAWRTVEETQIASVGDALVGHLEIRFGPECTVISDFIAPSSLTLRSRWSDMVSSIGDLRSTAALHVVMEKWEAEDTNPVGVPAIAGGFLAPLAVMLFVYMMMSNLLRFETPVFGIRALIGSISLTCAFALAFQARAFMDGIPELRYVDNLLLLTFVGGMSASGALLGSRAGSLALVASSISGVALVVSAFYGWTPDPALNGTVGGILSALGIAGIYGWTMVESGAFRGVKRK